VSGVAGRNCSIMERREREMRADLWMDKSKEIQSLSTGKNSVVVSGEKGRGTCLAGRVSFTPVVMISAL
jgi:hypothetical protein